MTTKNLNCRLNQWTGILLCLLSSLTMPSQAQKDTLKGFKFTGQLMQRAEFRNGYGQLIKEGEDPAFSVGQRARINAVYHYKDIQFYVSAQDIRIWGSTGNTKLTDNLLSIYEAKLEAKISNHWKVKLGRQELNYDNVRFLGNLDWALQGRSHDAALLKYEKNSLKLHLAVAYNQTGLSLTDQPYAIPNHYKTAQMFHLENKGSSFDWALLFWNQGIQQPVLDDDGQIVDWKNRYSQTIGLPVLRYRIKNFTLFGFYYHQLGKDPLNRNLDAFDASAQISWKRANKEKERNFQVTLGAEYLSGNDRNPRDATQRAFIPFYGTNHAHNGYMDYFFAGNGNNNGYGLFDRFIRLKYQANAKNFWSLNAHSFASTGEVVNFNGNPLSSDLGLELDLSTGYIFNDALSIQFGYSQLFASGTMKFIQSAEDAKDLQNWAYVMLLFRPNSNNKFVGLSF